MEAVRMEHICKSFYDHMVVKNVDFHLNTGEVMALLGENGAGKSTLMKILSGVFTCDSGEITIFGNKIEGSLDSKKANELGIAIIHQELNLCQHLTVAENIFLGKEIMKNGRLDEKEMSRQTRAKLDELGITDLDPDTPVSRLPLGRQQLVAITKALLTDAKVYIMDEPTSSLSDNDVNALFEIIRDLKAKGKAIVYISHRLQELYHIVDRVTIMRDGDLISEGNLSDYTLDQIIANMVGRRIENQFPRDDVPRGEKILEVKHMCTIKRVKDVCFDLYEGEVLGFAGLVGSGRTKISSALFGSQPMISGELILRGKKIEIKCPADAIKHGILLAPEDRAKEGLCTRLSIRENMTLPNMDLVCDKTSRVDIQKENDLIQTMKEKLVIKMSDENNMAGSLSGGNQQKIVIGKWLARDFNVIILDEPTRGIDVMAKAEIYEIINELKRKGIGVILISSELPELMGISDRILVMCDGRITGEVDPRNTTEEEIMTYATSYGDRSSEKAM